METKVTAEDTEAVAAADRAVLEAEEALAQAERDAASAVAQANTEWFSAQQQVAAADGSYQELKVPPPPLHR